MKKTIVLAIFLLGFTATAGYLFSFAQQEKTSHLCKNDPAGQWGKHKPFHALGSEFLGMTDQELKVELESGKTFFEIAQDKGITKEQLEASILEQATTRLQGRVTNGQITQEQADQKLQMIKDHQVAGEFPRKPFSDKGMGKWKNHWKKFPLETHPEEPSL